jgi:hypothetical protein
LVNAKFDISEAVGSNKTFFGGNFMLIKKNRQWSAVLVKMNEQQ